MWEAAGRYCDRPMSAVCERGRKCVRASCAGPYRTQPAARSAREQALFHGTRFTVNSRHARRHLASWDTIAAPRPPAPPSLTERGALSEYFERVYYPGIQWSAFKSRPAMADKPRTRSATATTGSPNPKRPHTGLQAPKGPPLGFPNLPYHIGAAPLTPTMTHTARGKGLLVRRRGTNSRGSPPPELEQEIVEPGTEADYGPELHQEPHPYGDHVDPGTPNIHCSLGGSMKGTFRMKAWRRTRVWRTRAGRGRLSWASPRRRRTRSSTAPRPPSSGPPFDLHLGTSLDLGLACSTRCLVFSEVEKILLGEERVPKNKICSRIPNGEREKKRLASTYVIDLAAVGDFKVHFPLTFGLCPTRAH